MKPNLYLIFWTVITLLTNGGCGHGDTQPMSLDSQAFMETQVDETEFYSECSEIESSIVLDSVADNEPSDAPQSPAWQFDGSPTSPELASEPKTKFDPTGGLHPPAIAISDAVAETLADTRAAMARRDLLTASVLLKGAMERHRRSSDYVEIERTWLIYRLLLRFWAAVGQGASSLKVGQEIMFGGNKATVVTRHGDRATLHMDDESRRDVILVPMQMSADLAVALARQQLLASGTVGDRMIASFHLLDADGDPETAKMLCGQMRAAGLEVDLFLTELEHSLGGP